MQKIRRFKKLLMIALLASVLVTPIAIKSYAQEDTTPAEETQTQTEEQEQEVEPDPTPPPGPEEETVEDDEQPVDGGQDPPTPQEVDLAAAITIAQAQHPDVEVIMAKVKLKKLDGEKVYKVVFADGWRIYVRASDGEIVRIKDASNKKRECTERARQAIANWRDKQYQRWGQRLSDHRKHYHGSWHKYQKDWRKQRGQEQPSEQQAPVETEEQSEE